VAPDYNGTVTIGSGNCALGIASTTVQVTNGTFSTPVTATGPGFARSATGYLCSVGASSPNPATIVVGSCTYSIGNGVTTFRYNMRKPANC
jgi:hypothetical protein